MFEKFINKVEKVIDSKQLLTSKEALLAYSLDATRLKSMPKAVFLPETSKQLRDVIRLCNEFSISVIPRGSGTSLSGGAVPAKGSLVISFSRMNSILNIDTTNLIAEVEPGVITANLQEEVSDQSLFYPPDPSSAAVSTIGGNIAEGAGGPKALKYGVTRDYVMGLEVVLPDGSLIRTGGSTYKNVSGYDLTRLMTASEGSLGLITKAYLKLLPAPEESLSYLLTFKTLEKASKAVVEIIKSGILPTALEIMDKVTAKAVEKYAKIEIISKAEALLLLELDGYGLMKQAVLVDKVLKTIKPLSVKKAKSKKQSENFWQARKAALPALSSIAPSVLLEDVTVMRSELPSLIRGIQKIAKNNNLVIGCFGHAGDGNLHPTIVTDLRDEKNAQNTKKVIKEIFELALQLGGTITGEHGIGLIKKEYLEKELGKKSQGIMEAIKKVFDEKNILNPEKIFKK